MSTVRQGYDLHQTLYVVLFLSTVYDVRTKFHKIIELAHSTNLYSEMNNRNRTKKQLNYEIIPMYIYKKSLDKGYFYRPVGNKKI